MDKIAVFPGSFDPITVGHFSIIERALPLFDKIIIAIGENSSKTSLFSIEQREKWIAELFKNEQKISVEVYSGLTIDFCKKHQSKYLIRGLRTSADFEFERSIGQSNKKLYPEIETVFLLTLPEHTFITATIVRDIYKNGGNIQNFVPDAVFIDLQNKL